MNKAFDYFRKASFLLGISFIFNIISWLVIATQIKPNGEQLPLHYNVFYGADLTGNGYYLYLLPFAGLVILTVNYFFYRYAGSKEPFAAKSLLVVSIVVELFVLVAVEFLKSIII
ncbi:MAG: hypothetical protein NVSMB66_1050 [Candidatus Doudnabacteria bacterium]